MDRLTRNRFINEVENLRVVYAIETKKAVSFVIIESRIIIFFFICRSIMKKNLTCLFVRDCIIFHIVKLSSIKTKPFAKCLLFVCRILRNYNFFLQCPDTESFIDSVDSMMSVDDEQTSGAMDESSVDMDEASIRYDNEELIDGLNGNDLGLSFFFRFFHFHLRQYLILEKFICSAEADDESQRMEQTDDVAGNDALNANFGM